MRLAILSGILLLGCIGLASSDDTSNIEFRKQIGPVYNPPVVYKGNLYFLASTGILYKGLSNLTSVKNIFQTKLNSVSGIILNDGVLYFGEGLHDDNKTNLYAYDVIENKVLFKTEVAGHIEKTPSIFKNLVIVGLGPGGISAFDSKTGKAVWAISEYEGKKIHVDSTPIVDDEKIYFGSIYENKSIFCHDANSGKYIWSVAMAKSPKADLVLSGEKLVSIATEADFSNKNRVVPSDFVVLDLKTGKILLSQPLRGYTVFPQIVEGGEAFVSLSTGDIILVNIETGKIKVVDQFPEPFLASTFKRNDDFCAASVVGRLVCYKNNVATKKDKLGDAVLGNITKKIDGKIYLPTRMAYRIL